VKTLTPHCSDAAERERFEKRLSCAMRSATGKTLQEKKRSATVALATAIFSVNEARPAASSSTWWKGGKGRGI